LWVGWVYQNGRWLAVVEGKTLGSCSRRLHAAAEAQGVVGNVFRAMTGGRCPTWTPGRQDALAAPGSRPAELDDG
jgi:hypothetical protein